MRRKLGEIGEKKKKKIFDVTMTISSTLVDVLQNRTPHVYVEYSSVLRVRWNGMPI